MPTQRNDEIRFDPDQYDDVAERFDRYSERTGFPITECLMEMTQVRRGRHLLDVACGSGIVTRRAAEIVGETGKAVGIDLSPGQIRVARRKAKAQGLGWAQFIVMDAMNLTFPDNTFDVVVAQFPHFPDRGRCIGEMVRVLRPGGRFAICNGGGGATIWGLKNAPTPADIPKGGVVDGLFRSCLETHFPQLIAPPAGNAPVQSVDPQTALRNELEQGGLLEIALGSYAHTSPFHTAEEAFEWESVRTSPYRMQQAALEPQSVEAFKGDYLRRVQKKLDRHGVLGLTTGALLGVGVKPKG
ncbi:MAG: methyltransferase domain-containing protein [Candidatus Poribacteria bacterium]|nr:methyltransferase domain-containing protein [Candidatus Poribacteria bacterium]